MPKERSSWKDRRSERAKWTRISLLEPKQSTDSDSKSVQQRPSPLQNRVTPWGEIVAVPNIYSDPSVMFGNRGVLHDSEYNVVRSSATKAWLGCHLRVTRTRKEQRDDNRAFNGRKRVLMTPGRYTELFFLDEATAMAAGHRPCACCRRYEYGSFMTAVHASGAAYSGFSAPQLDQALHAERLGGDGRKRIHPAKLGGLPDGVMITLNETVRDAWLLWKGWLHRWTHEGYDKRVPLPSAETKVMLLTPPTLVAALTAGFAQRQPHESSLMTIPNPDNGRVSDEQQS